MPVVTYPESSQWTQNMLNELGETSPVVNAMLDFIVPDPHDPSSYVMPVGAQALRKGMRLGGSFLSKRAIKDRLSGIWDKYLLTNKRVKIDGFGIGTQFEVIEPKGNMVRVYRAAPQGTNTINPGDYVTASKSYAEEHLRKHVSGKWLVENPKLVGGGDIITTHIPKDELGVAAANELVYIPKKMKRVSAKKIMTIK